MDSGSGRQRSKGDSPLVIAVNPGHRSRIHLRLLLAVVGLLALADPADASGCHALDRPVFGMTDDPIDGLSASDSDPGHFSPQSTHYRHAPCPGESAGFSAKFKLPHASLATTVLHRAVTNVEGRWVEAPDLARPLADLNPPERPPRQSAFLAD
jgi:hypothetical protein